MLKSDSSFKEAIGAFVIAFSEFEYGLVFLCAMTDFDLLRHENYIVKYLGFPFEKKLRHLTEFISEYLKELYPTWAKIKEEIEQINTERRFLVHGFVMYTIPREKITTHVKIGSRVLAREHTVKDIRKLTIRLQHLNTGKNGIRGEFQTLFISLRFNKWNLLVNDEFKLVYENNGITLTDWKGKKKK